MTLSLKSIFVSGTVHTGGLGKVFQTTTAIVRGVIRHRTVVVVIIFVIPMLKCVMTVGMVTNAKRLATAAVDTHIAIPIKRSAIIDV